MNLPSMISNLESAINAVPKPKPEARDPIPVLLDHRLAAPPPRPRYKYRTRLLRRLFGLAKRTGLEIDDVRAACGVRRLRDATDAMLQSAIVRFDHGRPNTPMPPSRRKRRGRKLAPGVIAMITPRQKDLINRLIAKLGWQNPLCLNRYLGGNWRMALDGAWLCDSIMTARGAMEMINVLIGWSKKLKC